MDDMTAPQVQVIDKFKAIQSTFHKKYINISLWCFEKKSQRITNILRMNPPLTLII